MRPCGMCSRPCWQCGQRYERLKAEWQQQEERVASLEIAFAEADDRSRSGLAERLQDAIEAWWALGEELDELSGDEP